MGKRLGPSDPKNVQRDRRTKAATKMGKKVGPRYPSRLLKELRESEKKEESPKEEEMNGNLGDFYECDEVLPEEMSGKNRRYDNVDQLEYELPSDFEDEEIDEDTAFGEDEYAGTRFIRKVEDEINLDSAEEESSHEEAGAAAGENEEDEEEVNDFDSNSMEAQQARSGYEDEADLEEDEDEDDAVDDERHAKMVAAVTRKPVKSTPERKPRKDYVVSEAYPESEYNVNQSLARTDGLTDLRGITVDDLMASLQGTAGVGVLKKKLRGRLRPKAPIQVPLPRVIQEKVERRAGYEKAKEEISKWQPIIKKNREAPTIVYNQRTSFQTTSTAALAATFKPTTEFEKEIAGLLRESHLVNVKEIEAAESLELNKLTVEEVRERQERLAKMRNLLFQHEARAKRIKKIKSKTFHRLLQKSQKRKERGNMVDVNPEASKDEAFKQEFKRAQERITLKHKNTSRWAKRILKRGLQVHTDDGTRDAIAEQLRTHTQLTRKMHSATGNSTDEDTSSEDDNDADVENEENGLVLEKKPGSKTLAKAKMATLKFLEGDEEADIPDTGLFALPFMVRAIEKKRKEAQIEAMTVLDQLEQAEADGFFSAEYGGRDALDMDPKEVTGLLRFGDMKPLRTGKLENSDAHDMVEEQPASEAEIFDNEVTMEEKPEQLLNLLENCGKTVDATQSPIKVLQSIEYAELDGMASLSRGHMIRTKAPVSLDSTDFPSKIHTVEGSPAENQSSADGNTSFSGALSDDVAIEVLRKSVAGINPMLFGDTDRKLIGINLHTNMNASSAKDLPQVETKKKRRRQKEKFEGLTVNRVGMPDTQKEPDVRPKKVSIAGNSKQVQKKVESGSKSADRSAILEVHSNSITEPMRPAFTSSCPNAEGSDDEDVVVKYSDQNSQLLDGLGSQEELVRKAFAGDDVEAEFEEAKLHTLDNEVPAVEGPISLPGWGQWTSIQKKHGPPSWILKEQESQRKIREAALSKRKDAKMKYAIVSEKMDRKAGKFTSASVPFPYTSREVFEKTMRMPIGRDFNTDEAFRNMIRPSEIKSAGVIIDPIKYEKPRTNGKRLELNGHNARQKQKRGRSSVHEASKQQSKRPKS